MIRVKYIRPEQWQSKDLDGKVLTNNEAWSLILKYTSPLSLNLWTKRFNDDGHIHLDTLKKVEFIMWDDERVKPIEGVFTPLTARQ